MSEPDAPPASPPLPTAAAPDQATDESPLGHDAAPAPSSPAPGPDATLDDDSEAPPAIELVEPQHAPEDDEREVDPARGPSGTPPDDDDDDVVLSRAPAEEEESVALEDVSLAGGDTARPPVDDAAPEENPEVDADGTQEADVPPTDEAPPVDDVEPTPLAAESVEPVPASPDAAENEGEGAFEDVSLSRAPSVVPAVRALRDEVQRDAAELQADTPMVQATAREDAPEPEDLEPLPASASASEPVEAAPSSAPAPAPAAAPAPAPSTPAPSSSQATTTTSSPQIEPKARRESMASVTTVSAPGSSHLVSGILIVSSLETIAATKEAKRSKPLKDALDRALDALKSPVPSTPGPAPSTSATVDPHVVFTPLRLACETRSLPLMITALDCIGKLVSYDFFVEQHDPDAPQLALGRDDDNESLAGGAGGVNASQQNLEALPLADQITSTVCDCFSPSPSNSTSSSSSSSSSASSATTQHDTLLLRLLSCLLSLILSSSLPVHQSALLKAVRTVYNVFLLGRAGTVQTVAQATLGQIVGGVFGRVSLDQDVRTAAAAGATGGPDAQTAGPAVGLGLGAGAGVGGTPGPSRSGSRTDLASVAEEDSAAAPGPSSATEGAAGVEAADEATEQAEPTPRVPQDGMEGPPAEQEEQEAGAANGGDHATPRVSVTQDGEERALDSQGEGEKITRCARVRAFLSAARRRAC